MPALERFLKAIPIVRRPFYQRDVALAGLQAAKAELATLNAELATLNAELATTNAELAAISAATLRGNSALASRVRGMFGPHWFLLPEDDPRQDQAIGDLRAHVARSVPSDSASLEIGPSYNPILAKRAGYGVMIVDHADQAALVEKY